ncbi:hypothetical protein V1514DRAFT_367795 [Lipomyces japonicus]|uniref:uncharacterized protein n=1 Tax=Lipomyces japonicus TaxID=56871 RepID=UPI0034CE4C03
MPGPETFTERLAYFFCRCNSALDIDATNCTEFLSSFIPRNTDEPQNSQDSEEYNVSIDKASAAFEHGECPGLAGVPSSELLLTHIDENFQRYNDGAILSPYTSVVGPSGIGKSFTAKQLANSQGVYVVYSSFAVSDGSAYPPRSEVPTSIRNIAEAKNRGIEPQYLLRAYYYKTFGQCIDLIYSNSTTDEIRVSNDQERRIRDGIARLRSMKNDEPVTSAPAQRSHRFAVVCIDEARGLLVESKLHFRAFRKACAIHFDERKVLKNEGKFVEGENVMFFGVLLDTLSKVSDFSPQTSRDRSARNQNKDLAPPFYVIDTWCSVTLDAAVDSTDAESSDSKRAKSNIDLPYPDCSKTQYASILRVGRPLWWGLLDAGLEVDDVSFLDDRNNSRSVALLSYRMQIDIASPTFAESLVASYMRYVLTVMLEFRQRRRILEDFVQQVLDGLVNIGQAGEIVTVLLLLFAADECLLESSEFVKPMAIPIFDFFAKLFGDQFLKNGRRGKVWKKGNVHVSHFVRLEDKPTQDDLEMAFKLGRGLLLPENFKAIDMIIPVWLSEEEPVTCLVIQVKNRRNHDDVTQSFKDIVSNMCLFAATDEAMLWDKQPNVMAGVIFGFGRGDVDESEFEHWNEKGKTNSTLVAAVGLDISLFLFLGKSNDNTGSNGEYIVMLLRRLLSWPRLRWLVKDGDEGGYAKSLVYQCIRSSDYQKIK